VKALIWKRKEKGVKRVLMIFQKPQV